MAAPLPPRVLGPISECSSAVHVQGQLTGSKVTVFVCLDEAIGRRSTPAVLTRRLAGGQRQPARSTSRRSA